MNLIQFRYGHRELATPPRTRASESVLDIGWLSVAEVSKIWFHTQIALITRHHHEQPYKCVKGLKRKPANGSSHGLLRLNGVHPPAAAHPERAGQMAGSVGRVTKSCHMSCRFRHLMASLGGSNAVRHFSGGLQMLVEIKLS